MNSAAAAGTNDGLFLNKTPGEASGKGSLWRSVLNCLVDAFGAIQS